MSDAAAADREFRALRGRLAGLVAVAAVRGASVAGEAFARLAVRLLGGDDDVERVEPFGLQSTPVDGAEAVLVRLGGKHLAIVVGDRRYRVELAAGEVAVVNAHGLSIRLLEERVEVTAPTVVVDADVVSFGDPDAVTSARIVREGDTVQVGTETGPITVTVPVASVCEVKAS